MTKVVKIPITGGVHVIIDTEDLPIFNLYKWRAFRKEKSGSLYVKTTISKNKCLVLHRFLMGVTDPRVFVDHKNRDTLDNTRVNLRACSPAENSRNQVGKPNQRFSKYKGVAKHRKRFSAKINKIHIGTFDTQEEAAKAYNEAAKRLHGEFALLNVIE